MPGVHVITARTLVALAYSTKGVPRTTATKGTKGKIGSSILCFSAWRPPYLNLISSHLISAAAKASHAHAPRAPKGDHHLDDACSAKTRLS